MAQRPPFFTRCESDLEKAAEVDLLFSPGTNRIEQLQQRQSDSVNVDGFSATRQRRGESMSLSQKARSFRRYRLIHHLPSSKAITNRSRGQVGNCRRKRAETNGRTVRTVLRPVKESLKFLLSHISPVRNNQ